MEWRTPRPSKRKLFVLFLPSYLGADQHAVCFIPLTCMGVLQEEGRQEGLKGSTGACS